MKPNQCPNNKTPKECSCNWVCNNITIQHIEEMSEEDYFSKI